jgi:hypothetical protein
VAVRELGLAGAFALATTILGTVLSALGYPVFIGLVVLDLVDGRILAPQGPLAILLSTLSLVLFGAGLAAIVVPALAALRQRGDWSLLAYVPLLPLYYGLVSVAAWRGLAELVLDPFRWNKTEHGLAPRPPMAGTEPGPAVKAAPGDPSRPLRAGG